MLANNNLEHASQLADARLGVAEELGWLTATLAATTAHLYWGSWPLSLSVFAATYYGVTFRYRRLSQRAEDAYNRAAGLGKYYRQAPATEDD
jgi:hypothetical protein